jgi:4-diphosphocytidyl-2-C-methyl-D-erythritol kinase
MAKINLALAVLGKRTDMFHEIRTVFQSISVADAIEIGFRRARHTVITVQSIPEIPNNIAGRVARAVLDHWKLDAAVDIRIEKRIPMGGGLGGGSSDAAAVLMALPALAGKPLDAEVRLRIACELGSDVAFFLLGGTALGIGRGEEIYPFPEPKPAHGLLLLPDLPVSTAEAYHALGRESLVPYPPSLASFQARCLAAGADLASWRDFCRNDFEEAIFARHPGLRKLHTALVRSGALLARMSGSGSALFGIFESKAAAEQAARRFPRTRTTIFRTISRAAYRNMWARALAVLQSGADLGQ